MIAMLQEIKDNRQDKTVEWVFPDENGLLWSYSLLHPKMQNFWMKQGLAKERIGFHRFRHSFATYLRASGVEKDIVSALMGHSCEDVAGRIYMDIESELKIGAIEKYYHYMKDVFEAGGG